MWGCSERVRKRPAPPHLALSFSSACPSPSSVFGNEPTVENVSPRSGSFRGKLMEPKDGVAGICGSRLVGRGAGDSPDRAGVRSGDGAVLQDRALAWALALSPGNGVTST